MCDANSSDATLMHDVLEVSMLKLLSACAGFLATSAAVLAAAQTPATPPQPAELKVGDAAPAFALQGSDGKIHKLSDYAGKSVVLAWFPKRLPVVERPSATRSVRAGNDSRLRRRLLHGQRRHARRQQGLRRKEQADFPILSDPDKKVANAYGVIPPSGHPIGIRLALDLLHRSAGQDCRDRQGSEACNRR